MVDGAILRAGATAAVLAGYSYYMGGRNQEALAILAGVPALASYFANSLLEVPVIGDILGFFDFLHPEAIACGGAFMIASAMISGGLRLGMVPGVIAANPIGAATAFVTGVVAQMIGSQIADMVKPKVVAA